MSLEILQGWRRGWALPDRRPIHDWARDFVQLGGGYARQGAFDIRTCRHLLEPFEAVVKRLSRIWLSYLAHIVLVLDRPKF